MPEELQDNSKKTSKEIWLFLIFVDIVALCVFGFFIYKSFFNDFDFASLIPQTAAEEEVLAETDVQENILVEDEKLPQEEAPSVKPEEPKPVQNEAEAKPVKPAETEAEKPTVKAEPKKQSVFVSGTGKTRKVTFKYYGNAKSVSIISGFTMRKPVALKKSGGVWSTTLVIYPGEYRYMFVVDGKETPDPNAAQDDGRSVVVIK